MKKIYKNLLACLLISSSLGILNAQLIISEPFDYPAGNIKGGNGGTGFATAWSSTTTDAATAIGVDGAATITAGSINATNGTGNKGKFCIQAGKSTRWDRKFAANTLDGADGTVYWMSFWYKNTLSDTFSTTKGSAAQLILMGTPNDAAATEQRLGFGKTSNINTENIMTVFTRASPAGCGAANWGQAVKKSSTGTYFVLVKITKGEYTLGTPAAKFDGIRTWLFAAPPASEADFTTRALGDLTQLDSLTSAALPIQTKLLRADNNSNTTCVRGGVSGIRIRVEGGSETNFCPEFDEFRLGTTFASVTSKTSSVDDAAKLSAQIAPNPTKTNLYITLEEDAKKASVSVFDMLGRSVLSNKFSGIQSELNVENLIKGMYFINIQADGKTITQKFVKE
jgi:hypothetical protein